MTIPYVFVDLQGFRDYKKSFIVKEFAIATNEFTQTYLVKPPYPFSTLTDDEKKQVRWLEKYRGIYWREGFVDYNEFQRLAKPLLERFNVVVKGFEKLKWIKELSPNCEVIDVGEQGCPNLASLNQKYSKNKNINCFYHSKYCALKNVICVKEWYCDNK